LRLYSAQSGIGIAVPGVFYMAHQTARPSSALGVAAETTEQDNDDPDLWRALQADPEEDQEL
jgi:hypothetical protein